MHRLPHPAPTPIALCCATCALTACVHADEPLVEEPSSALRASSNRLISESVEAGAESCHPTACDPVTPSDELITDFEGLGPDGVFVDNDRYADRPAD